MMRRPRTQGAPMAAPAAQAVAAEAAEEACAAAVEEPVKSQWRRDATATAAAAGAA